MEDKIEKRDNQDKIKWLKRYIVCDRHINRLLEEKEEWMTKATKVNQQLSGMPHGGQKINMTELAIERISEIEAQINDEIDGFVEIRKDIETAINAIVTDELRLLLKLRYIDGKSWEQIAVVMHYTYRHTTRRHGEALNHLQIIGK